MVVMVHASAKHFQPLPLVCRRHLLSETIRCQRSLHGQSFDSLMLNTIPAPSFVRGGKERLRARTMLSMLAPFQQAHERLLEHLIFLTPYHLENLSHFPLITDV